jgi:hypothetical protein
MSATLPDCMMPDGADPCRGYHELRAKNERLAAFLDELAERMATPDGFFVETVIRDCRAMAAKLRGER